ncbi:MAG: DUF29 domain-containing protein [Alphaproteobacteria bacterium]|nr:DUF29 domain-containing protein [Alphaproteobacteria bacterium]
MSETKTLYETDFVLWSQQQGDALRRAARSGTNLELDWENLAEEVESLGKSDRRELRSQILRIIRHLVKVEHSPAIEPRRGWKSSIRDARDEIRTLLQDSPSLAREVDRYVAEQTERGVRQAIEDIEERGEIGSLDLSRLRGASYTPEQVLGDWFPGEPR